MLTAPFIGPNVSFGFCPMDMRRFRASIFRFVEMHSLTRSTGLCVHLSAARTDRSSTRRSEINKRHLYRHQPACSWPTRGLPPSYRRRYDGRLSMNGENHSIQFSHSVNSRSFNVRTSPKLDRLCNEFDNLFEFVGALFCFNCLLGSVGYKKCLVADLKRGDMLHCFRKTISLLINWIILKYDPNKWLISMQAASNESERIEQSM